jgi:L-methionine (R)-S-oxide reductase
MHTTSSASTTPDYDLLVRQAASILTDERDMITNAAQFSAFIFQVIGELNWAGFYFVRPGKDGQGSDLLLGPFQGRVACTRIPFGRGVCGAAATERRTFLVPDVHAFPGHIACDSASNAEIVIPVVKHGQLIGVFDIDSPVLNRFSAADQAGLEALVAGFVEATDFA